MKNKARFLLIAVAASIAAAVIGCSMNNIKGGGGDSEITVGSALDKSVLRTVTMSVDNFEQYDSVTRTNVVTNASDARTILPSDTPAWTTGYDYYLYGKSTSGTEWVSDALTMDFTHGGLNDGKYSFTASLPTAYWQLTLIAVTTGTTRPTLANVPAVASLVGYSTVDLTSGDGTANFVLSTETLTSQGSLNLTLVWSDNGASAPWSLGSAYTDSGAEVSAELQSLADGKTLLSIPLTLSGTTGAKFQAAQTYAQGTYNFVVKFKSTSGKTSYWSDLIEVVAKRTNAGTVYVPNILGTQPTKVTSLYATYVKDSENADENRYKVHFYWNAATVLNEKSFKLDIADVSELTTDEYYDGATNAWATLAKNTEYDLAKFFSTESPRIDGSLNANNQSLTMWLELGKVYFARICSTNEFGDSDWTYLTIDDSATKASAAETPAYYDASNRVVAYFEQPAGTASKAINRYSITYDLNGGSYLPDTSNPTAGSTAFSKKYVVYNCIDKLNGTTAAKLWEPKSAADATSTKAELSRNKETFKSWYIGAPTQTNAVLVYDTTATPKGVTAAAVTKDAKFKAATDGNVGGYAGYKNMKFTACYSGEFGGVASIFEPTAYFLRTDWIKYSKTTEGATPTSVLSTGSNLDVCTMSLSKAAVENAVRFTVTIPAAAIPNVFEKYTVEIRKNDTYSSLMYESLEPVSGATFDSATTITDDISIGTWEVTSYTVKVNGIMSINGETLTRQAQFIMNLTD